MRSSGCQYLNGFKNMSSAGSRISTDQFSHSWSIGREKVMIVCLYRRENSRAAHTNSVKHRQCDLYAYNAIGAVLSNRRNKNKLHASIT